MLSVVSLKSPMKLGKFHPHCSRRTIILRWTFINHNYFTEFPMVQSSVVYREIIPFYGRKIQMSELLQLTQNSMEKSSESRLLGHSPWVFPLWFCFHGTQLRMMKSHWVVITIFLGTRSIG